MRWNPFHSWAAALVSLLLGATAAFAGERVLFETGFEKAEGYRPDTDLAGQDGWIAIGSGGNGVLAGPVDGFNGQVAYIGFSPPSKTNDFLNVFRPVAFTPVAGSPAIVTFKVSFSIFDSTTHAPFFDDFRWSAYNTREERLFTLDFDNEALEIHYALDDTVGFRPTGWGFSVGEPYDLVIVLNFARNRWTASINGAVIVDGQPITTRGLKADLNEIDAVWAIRSPGKPGDNFMVFDDYRLTALPADEVPPRVVWMGLLTTGPAWVRILGEPGVTYAVEQTVDLRNWVEFTRGKATAPDGLLDVQDTTAPRSAMRFYRARSIR